MMIDRARDLPVTRQSTVPNISRGIGYYVPRAVPDDELTIMRRLDELHLEFPFTSSWIMRGLLAGEGIKIDRPRVRALMKRMGIKVPCRHPRTTQPEPVHKIYLCLLRNMTIMRPNQVWEMDITYIPMARVYLAAVLD